MLTPAPSMPAIATGFVRKLYRILDQESGTVISWTRGGTAFAIFDDERLNELILPRYFRGRLCAFRQQLREHGFQQLLANEVAVPITPVASDSSSQCTYFHEHFVRGSPGRLSKIARTPLPRRRISSRKSKSGAGAAGGKRAAPSTVSAMKTDAKSSSMSAKRARVDNTASSASTASTASSTGTSTSTTLSSSSSSFGSASSSTVASTGAGISIMKDFSLTAPAPVRYQQQLQQPHHHQQQQQGKKNPLFSNESDPLFGDWLSLDDISPATGTSGTGYSSGAGVTTDISFSEDVLGALMNLVNTSMSTTSVNGTAAVVSPTSLCGSVTTCAAQEKKICNGTSTSSLSTSNSRSVCSAKKKALATGAVYETHQFSEDTINSMMLWLGSSGST